MSDRDLEDFIANFKPQTETDQPEGDDDDMNIITQSKQQSATQRRAASPTRRLAPVDPDDLDPKAVFRRRAEAREARRPGTVSKSKD